MVGSGGYSSSRLAPTATALAPRRDRDHDSWPAPASMTSQGANAAAIWSSANLACASSRSASVLGLDRPPRFRWNGMQAAWSWLPPPLNPSESYVASSGYSLLFDPRRDACSASLLRRTVYRRQTRPTAMAIPASFAALAAHLVGRPSPGPYGQRDGSYLLARPASRPQAALPFHLPQVRHTLAGSTDSRHTPCVRRCAPCG